MSLDHIEERLAPAVLRHHERTDARVVHLGGVAHTIVGRPRAVSPDALTHTNAGGSLHDALGSGYRAVLNTVGQGHAPQELPPAPPELHEPYDRRPLNVLRTTGTA